MAVGQGWAIRLVPPPRQGEGDVDDLDDWDEPVVVDQAVVERVLAERRAVQAAAQATPKYALTMIGDARYDRDRAQSVIDEWVPRALERGVAWSALAEVLGVSRQALQKRYRREDPVPSA